MEPDASTKVQISLPRKGTETFESCRLALMLCYTSSNLITPQGDGNTLYCEQCVVSYSVQISLPRKGTETITPSVGRFSQRFKSHYPARGRKHSKSLYSSDLKSGSNLITPQGDGNLVLILLAKHIRTSSNLITPQGDGNLTAVSSSLKRIWRSNLITPQGDGNTTFPFF